MAVVPHGVRLSLGGAEPLDPGRVTRLAACAAAVDAPLAVLGLLARLCERLDVAPAVMLERDGRYPPTLRAELDAIAVAAALPRPGDAP